MSVLVWEPDLTALSCGDLLAIYNALGHITEMLFATSSQPRFEAGVNKYGCTILTPAGKAVSDLEDGAYGMMDAIKREAEARPRGKGTDEDARFQLFMKLLDTPQEVLWRLGDYEVGEKPEPKATIADLFRRWQEIEVAAEGPGLSDEDVTVLIETMEALLHEAITIGAVTAKDLARITIMATFDFSQEERPDFRDEVRAIAGVAA